MNLIQLLAVASDVLPASDSTSFDDLVMHERQLIVEVVRELIWPTVNDRHPLMDFSKC